MVIRKLFLAQKIAGELAGQKALRAIQAAGDRDWRAWTEWLKLAVSR